MDDHWEPESAASDEAPPQEVGVRLIGAEELTVQYVNMVSINFDRSAFHVSFAQFLPPIILGPEDAKQLADQGFVPAQAVARLVLTPLVMEQTIQLMQAQLDQFRQRTAEAANEAGGELGA